MIFSRRDKVCISLLHAEILTDFASCSKNLLFFVTECVYNRYRSIQIGDGILTNFDFLRSEKRFSSFAGATAAAEKIFPIDTAACAVNVRRALELTLKWMFEADKRLSMPKRTSLAALISAPSLRQGIGQELFAKLEFIRRVGNNAAHHPASVTKEQAALALSHLFDFENFVAKRYGASPSPYPFDETLLLAEEEIVTEALDSERIAEILRENRSMKRMLRVQCKPSEDTDLYEEDPPSPHQLSEADTRRLYIETDLAHAGWRIGIDCLYEYRIDDLGAGSGVGYADYVLFDGKEPLAVVEAQAAGDDPAIGRQQAKLYADALERKHGTRPILFLSSGTDTRIWQDCCEHERRVAGIFSKEDLRRLKQLCRLRKSKRAECEIDSVLIDRPYQMEAVRAVVNAFCKEGKRRATLSMAPATGKTRTALAAVDTLYRAGIVQNVLYLTESDILAHQALRACTELPGVTCASLSLKTDIADAQLLIATYENLLSDADELLDKNGAPLLTPGHFDLILCDESDERITEKYRDIFETFDARLLFLSSTPAIADAVFSYPHEQAISDGYVAPMRAFSLRLASFTQGLSLSDMTDSEQQAYRQLFRTRGLRVPEYIPPEEMFRKYYNEDTVRLMFETLKKEGITDGELPAKTIIFTNDHAHSEILYEIWGKLYPSAPPHFCRVIDLTTNYAESLLTEFAADERPPQIALSHDLMNDGIDIPSVKNLVFFTKAASRAKFWRMLGRGMRLAEGKTDFFVLDLCGNFDTYEKGLPAPKPEPRSEAQAIFCLRVRLAEALQSLRFANTCEQLRKDTVREITACIRLINRDTFAARRYSEALDRYTKKAAYEMLHDESIRELCFDISHLLPPASESPAVLSLDKRMLTLMLAKAQGRTDAAVSETIASLKEDAGILAKRASNKRIAKQKKLLNRIVHNEYLETATLTELEEARRLLRPLVHFLPKADSPVHICIPDRILSLEEFSFPLSDRSFSRKESKP